MPNKVRRDKTRFPGIGPAPARKSQGAKSVKELLGRAAPALIPLNRERAQQAQWRDWLDAHLPATLARHVTGAVAKRGALVIFTDSAAWSARIRYALAELGAELAAAEPSISSVNVRVMPLDRRAASR